MGRITKTIPSSNGQVRMVEIRTAKGSVLTRGVRYLVKLLQSVK